MKSPSNYHKNSGEKEKKIVRETKSTTISTEESLSERAVRTLQTAVRTSS